MFQGAGEFTQKGLGQSPLQGSVSCDELAAFWHNGGEQNT